MSTIGDLVTPPKRMADTSLVAYREIAPSLSKREALVLNVILGFSYQPTAYEVVFAMKLRGEAKDANDVRPRITALCDKGVLIKGDKRPCTITGKQAYTYRLQPEDAA